MKAASGLTDTDRLNAGLVLQLSAVAVAGNSLDLVDSSAFVIQRACQELSPYARELLLLTVRKLADVVETVGA